MSNDRALRTVHVGMRVAAAWAMFAMAAIAHGQVYKCTDGTGKTTYADAPCSGGSKPLKLSNDGKGDATDPTACAQLLDETRRLDAEADRNAQRGRTESAESAKRRHALARQYQSRCAGIARATPSPK